ncbi:MAG TPA: hypothetical protein VEL47_04850 [Myxococcota bacterium]|nr:hypothetical protein [Myxococcota bacterium]
MFKKGQRLIVLCFGLVQSWLCAADTDQKHAWEFFNTPAGKAFYTAPSPTIEITTNDDKKYTISLEKLKELSPVLREMFEELGKTESAKVTISSKSFLILTYVYYLSMELAIDFGEDDLATKFCDRDEAAKIRQELFEINSSLASDFMSRHTSWRANDELHRYFRAISNSAKQDLDRFIAFKVVYQHLLEITDEEEQKTFIADAVAEGVDARLLEMPGKKFVNDKDYVKLVSPLLAWVLWQRYQMPLSPTIDLKFSALVNLSGLIPKSPMRDSRGREKGIQYYGDAVRRVTKRGLTNFVLTEAKLHNLDTIEQKMASAIVVLLNTLDDMGLKPVLAVDGSGPRKKKQASFRVNGYHHH